jgi:hypothetical protein
METIKTIKNAKSAGAACGAAAEAALGDTLTSRVLEVLRTMPKGKAGSLIGAFWEGFDSSAPTIRGLRRIKVTRSESVRIARGIDAGLQPGDSWAESVKAAPKAEKGKAVPLVGAFWEGFDKAAPSIRGLKRIKVTKSESVRIARGIDAGLAPVASWAESVKAAPKAETGKGSGGGRKPRPAGLPAGGKGAPAPSLSAQQAGKPAEPAPLPPCVGARQLVAQLVAFCHNHKSKLPTDFLLAVDDLAELAKAQLKS